MKMKIIKKSVWAANALLLGVLLWLAVQVFGGSGEAGLSTTAADPAARAHPSGPSRPLEAGEYENLLSSDSIVPRPPAPTPARRQTPPPATVDISQLFGRKLIGTIVAQDSAYAVFEEPSGRQTGAFKGETVGKAKLLGIWKDQVLVEIDGRRGYVPLQTATSKPPPPPREVASARDDAEAAVEAAIAEAADAEAEDEEPGDDETELDWDVITEPQYLEYLQNVGKYTSQVTIHSHFDSNKNPDGLVLAKVPRSSEAYKRGLRERDVIKSIQDVPVTDLQAALKVAYQVLRDEDYLVDVVIVRNGAEETLSYEIWPE